MNGRINTLDKKINQGLASSSALAGLFQPYSVGKFNFTAGFGGYNGQNAAAVGFGYRATESLAFKTGIASTGNNSTTYNAALNFEW